MADDKPEMDRGDSVRHASEEARARAVEKMKEAQKREADKKASGEGDADGDKKSDSSTATMADFVGEKNEKDNKADEPYEQMVDEGTGQPLLRQVKVYSPFKVYFDNDAFSISAVNGTGPFDILPGHKNFLSLLLPGDILIRARAGDETINIDRGVMHVHNDIIKVFLDV